MEKRFSLSSQCYMQGDYNFFLILMECIVRSSPLPLLGEALCQGTEVYILTALVK